MSLPGKYVQVVCDIHIMYSGLLSSMCYSHLPENCEGKQKSENDQWYTFTSREDCFSSSILLHIVGQEHFAMPAV